MDEERNFSMTHKMEDNAAISMVSLSQLGIDHHFEGDGNLFHNCLPSNDAASMCSLMGSASSFEGAEIIPFQPLNPFSDDLKDFATQKDDPMWNSACAKKSDPIIIGDNRILPCLNQLDDNMCGSVNMQENNQMEKNYSHKWSEYNSLNPQLDQHLDNPDGQKLSNKTNNSKTKQEKLSTCRTKHSSIEEKPSPSRTPPNSSNFHHLVDYIRRFSSSPKGSGAEEKEKRPRHVMNELFKTLSHGSKTTDSLVSTGSTRYRDRSLSVGGVPASRRKPDISCQAVYSIYDGILKEGKGEQFPFYTYERKANWQESLLVYISWYPRFFK